MKKIINGRKYDTETAECVGYMATPFNPNASNFYEEWLYKKKSGEFFLYGSGGELTPYATYIGTGDRNVFSIYDGENIFPISEKDAREWCEAYLPVSKYEAIFGKVEE